MSAEPQVVTVSSGVAELDRDEAFAPTSRVVAEGTTTSQMTMEALPEAVEEASASGKAGLSSRRQKERDDNDGHGEDKRANSAEEWFL